jgi:hypothetical protein
MSPEVIFQKQNWGSTVQPLAMSTSRLAAVNFLALRLRSRVCCEYNFCYIVSLY